MKSLISFYKALIANPRSMGTGIPSSTYLANVIASFVPINGNKLVIELGPGTGVITNSLLKHGIKPENLTSIELSPELANRLRKRFPTINIIQGDATQLDELLKNRTQPIQAIISSLPLLSLPPETTHSILTQIDQLLPIHGLYIQYTYGKKAPWSEVLKNFQLIALKRVWLNIPPARVLVYKKISSPTSSS